MIYQICTDQTKLKINYDIVSFVWSIHIP
jgi:hypothetical protein